MLRKVVSIPSTTCLSIGEKMSELYEKKYGKPFIPFHNPIDPLEWQNVEKVKLDSEYTITYAGKINENTLTNIKRLSNVVEVINKQGISISLLLHTSMSNYDMLVKHTDFLNLIAKNHHTIIQPGVERKLVMQHLAGSDLLFLPLGFDKKTREYAFLSMLTKVTEYMISQSPILVNCPEDFATYEYLQKYDAAFLCPLDDEKSLMEKVSQGLQDTDRKVLCSKNAYNLVMQNHTIGIVRLKFKNAIITKICN